MLRATHVNMTLSIGLGTLILTNSFSLHLFFIALYGIIQDWDHNRGFFANKFGFALPFKHRGFTHTLLFVILLMLFINTSIFSYKMGFNLSDIFNYSNILQYLEASKIDNMFLFILLHGHLIGDFMTKQGIPYFYPFIKSNVGLGLIRTGEGTGGKITGEMIINFSHSILNIGLLTYLFINHDQYFQIIRPKIEGLLGNDINLLLFFGLLQVIFIIFLFMKDIKNYIKNLQDFIYRLLKVFTYLFVGLFVSGLLVGCLFLFNINLTDIVSNLSNQQIVIEGLNYYFMYLISGIMLIYSLFLTKKYLVSIASTIAYMINVSYILLGLLLITIIGLT